MTIKEHILRESRIPKPIRDRLQNHAMDGDVSAKHYDRWDYLPEMQEALCKWEQSLLDAVKHHTAITPLSLGTPPVA